MQEPSSGPSLASPCRDHYPLPPLLLLLFFFSASCVPSLRNGLLALVISQSLTVVLPTPKRTWTVLSPSVHDRPASVSFSLALAGQSRRKSKAGEKQENPHFALPVNLIRHSGSPPNHPSIKGQHILELGWAGLGWPSLLPNHCCQKGSGLSQVSSAPELLSREGKGTLDAQHTSLARVHLRSRSPTSCPVLFLIAPILISCMCHNCPAPAPEQPA